MKELLYSLIKCLKMKDTNSETGDPAEEEEMTVLLENVLKVWYVSSNLETYFVPVIRLLRHTCLSIALGHFIDHHVSKHT